MKSLVAKKSSIKSGHPSYAALMNDISSLLNGARSQTARTVNAIMTATYWEIGHQIVEFEQSGEQRAEYGEELLKRLSADLTAKFGRGFAKSNLYQMRIFYLTYAHIFQATSEKSRMSTRLEKFQTMSGKSELLQTITESFPLPWSAYVLLMAVSDESARQFYEKESLRGGWSVRQLDRQISTQFYERTLLSKNKKAMLQKGEQPQAGEVISPEEAIKDPYVLDFLDLKDEYSESDLEDALIRHLEQFLLELGGDFTFVGRQKRLRIGNAWYRVDLVFYHRRLRSLVIIDLKIGKFTHADAGQMHMYLNYAEEHWTHPGENPPVGLVLCSEKDSAVIKYAVEKLPNKVSVSEYKLALPKEKQLKSELEKTRRLLENRPPRSRS